MGDDSPTLRELEGSIMALDRVMQLQFAAQAEALKLQTREIERRLEHLNGEQARIQLRDAIFLPREIFDQHKEESDRRYTDILKTLANTKGSSQGMRDLWGWLVAGIITVIAVVSMFLKNQ